MKNKFLATVLMATVLIINNSNAQSGKLKELNNINFFGKKSYNYKNFGLQNAEENLKRAKSNYNYSVNARKKRGYRGGKNDNRFYENLNRFYGFSYNDFGRDATFDPVLDRASRITDLMDDHLRLSQNQEYNMFRLNVLFVSDLMQLQQENSYAYGTNYGGRGNEREIRDIIFGNYFEALEDIFLTLTV